PDAHIVHMHRDPVDIIASGASLNTTLWRMHADDVDPTEVGRQWIDRMAWTNGRAMAARDRMADEATRVTDIWFRDARADPITHVERVYGTVGIALSPEARAAMTKWLDGHGRDTLAPNNYKPEVVGLPPGEIRSSFAYTIA